MTRDGIAELVSREQILRHGTGTGKYSFSLFSWPRAGFCNLTRLIYTLLYVVTAYIHTYIHRVGAKGETSGVR